MTKEKDLLISTALGLGTVSAFSIPALIHLVKHIRDRNPKTDGYEDADGKSSEEAIKAFSTKLPKTAILILSILGFCSSIAIAVLSTLHLSGKGDGLFWENWLIVTGWVS